jgi:alanine-synthesizing transaminase
MRFSERTAWEAEDGGFAVHLAAARATGRPLIDLTRSNPTECGLGYADERLLAPLAEVAALRYEPEPLGMVSARRAVAAYYGDAGAAVDVARVCLTTSTSEGYSFLFRMLCDPGDEVLIAQPSYPLFDSIARLDGVELRHYPLFYDPTGHTKGWSIDLVSLERSITSRTRAVVVVHPNNPTGQYASAVERTALINLCVRYDLALIVDEVFLDYGFDGLARPSFLGERSDALCFVLSGLSKVCGLPQMKASWIVAHGAQALVDEAMRRLEIVADTFLSMNAPIQHALPEWLAGRAIVQDAIRERVRCNIRVLDERLIGSASSRLAAEGGWTAVLRVPRAVDGVEFGEVALERGVVVQPGVLYGMPEGRVVLSLLTEPEVWRRGLELLPL